MSKAILDERIVRVSVEVRGQLKIYESGSEGLKINVSGTKYDNANQNECQIEITNLDADTRNYLLTETSPFNPNRTPKRVIVEAGRKSYGTTQLFLGDIVQATPTQPPDIGVKIKALTGNFYKGNVVSRTQPPVTKLSDIAKQVAQDLGATLKFEAAEKNIANHSYNGAAIKQIDALGDTGAVNAYLDDGVLVVKDYNAPLSGVSREVNAGNGMIGLPESTEQGIKVKFLLDRDTTLGGLLNITSKVNPAVDGSYCIYKLSFEVSSRDEPFYWLAEAKRLGGSVSNTRASVPPVTPNGAINSAQANDPNNPNSVLTNAPPSVNPANQGDLTGTLRHTLRKELLNVDVMLPAKVLSYDRVTNRASVQPMVNMVTTLGETIPRGAVASVPVMLIGGGGFFISFDLQPGDFGWLKACDRDISLFLQSYSQQKPNTARIHNFSDSVFVPDVMKDHTIAGEDASAAVVQSMDGSVKVSLSNVRIKIKAPLVEIDAPQVTMTGDLAVAGDVTAGAISLKTHVHTDVQSGTSNTGGPI